MSDPNALFHSSTLESTALGVNFACAAARAGTELAGRDRTALKHAREFVDQAMRGERIRRTHHLSATPTKDLLALRYAQEAAPDKLRDERVQENLRKLADALKQASEHGRFPQKAPWTLESIDELWRRLFWLASGMSARPTDVQATRFPIAATPLGQPRAD